MKQKKGGIGFWILILALIAIGVGIYFWLSKGGLPGGIPKPPALPG